MTQCVAIDAVVETELVSALKVSVFPEIIFTKAGKILYREKGIPLIPRNCLKLSVQFLISFSIYDLRTLIFFFFNWWCSHSNCR